MQRAPQRVPRETATMTKKPIKSTEPKERRLIRRKKLTIDPRYVVSNNEANTTIYNKPPSGHKIYSLIGQIAMEWAFVETVLDAAIKHLADTSSEVTACFTAQMMGHVPRCLTIRALAHWRGLQEIDEAAERLQNALHEASELRNRAIHDALMIESKTNVVYKEHKMSKKERTFGLKEFDLAKLEESIVLIKRRQQDCSKLNSMVLDQVYEYVP
jgi:hypothetical protein